jgi:hypothetical protein
MFYVPVLIVGLFMFAYGLADSLGLLSKKRRLKCPPSAYSFMGLGLIVVVASRLIDQAYPFQGDGFAILIGMSCIAWGAIIQRRERLD